MKTPMQKPSVAGVLGLLEAGTPAPEKPEDDLLSLSSEMLAAIKADDAQGLADALRKALRESEDD